MTKAKLMNQVRSDIQRSGLTATISIAIDNAIKHYVGEDWWFLETRDGTLTASSSEAYCALPTDFEGIDTLMITVSGSRTPLHRRHYSEIEEKDDGLSFGQPTEFALQQSKIRLWTVPEQDYVLTLSYGKNLDAPSASGSNAWTGVASELIRHASVEDVKRNYLHETEAAQIAEGNKLKALDALEGKHINVKSTGRLKKSGW